MRMKYVTVVRVHPVAMVICLEKSLFIHLQHCKGPVDSTRRHVIQYCSVCESVTTYVEVEDVGLAGTIAVHWT